MTTATIGRGVGDGIYYRAKFAERGATKAITGRGALATYIVRSETRR